MDAVGFLFLLERAHRAFRRSKDGVSFSICALDRGRANVLDRSFGLRNLGTERLFLNTRRL